MLEKLKKIFPSDSWISTKHMENKDIRWWEKLDIGYRLRFGQVPQESISCTDMVISDIHQYLFRNKKFLAYILHKQNATLPECQIIVVDNSTHNSSTKSKKDEIYLAISRHLTKDELYELCDEDDIAKLRNTQKLNTLHVREHAVSSLSGWITMRYTKYLDGIKGQKVIGDILRNFNYTLLVSDDNEKAIEIELYDNGHCEIYVTVYRKLSDIIQIVPPAKQGEKPHQQATMAMPDISGYKAGIADLLPVDSDDDIVGNVKKYTIPELSGDEEQDGKEKIDGDKIGTTTEGAASAGDDKEDKENVTKTDSSEQRELSTTPSSSASSSSDEEGLSRIDCNISVAARLIDEAISNDMRLSDVVRRIIGLPVITSQKVSFELDLSAKEINILAHRYNISPDDHVAISNAIEKELSEFSGAKDSRKTKGQVTIGKKGSDIPPHTSLTGKIIINAANDDKKIVTLNEAAKRKVGKKASSNEKNSTTASNKNITLEDQILNRIMEKFAGNSIKNIAETNIEENIKEVAEEIIVKHLLENFKR